MKKLYFLFFVVGFSANAQVAFFYPSPICSSSTSVAPIVTPGFIGGGTFSSFPGLLLNAFTGVIEPGASNPGTYVVTYSVPASPPDFIAQSGTTTVTISPMAVPVFDPIGPVCLGANPPVLPSVSNNGISGYWTPSTVDNHTTTTYTFVPNGLECAVSTSMTVTVFYPYVPVINTVSGLNTVYVNSSNEVVHSVELTFEIPEGYTYQWYEETSLIPGATSSNYLVDTASLTGSTRFYRVWVTNTETGCDTLSSMFAVFQSDGVPPPIAPRYQNLVSGSTLADLEISGENIRWYDSTLGKNATAVELPLNTLLTDNTTYYASQTIAGNESIEKQPITVNLTLGVGESELISIRYSPNPVKNNLTIKSATAVDTISIINVFGQLVKKETYNQTEIVIDMNGLVTGTYFVRINSEGKSKVLKVIKE